MACTSRKQLLVKLLMRPWADEHCTTTHVGLGFTMIMDQHCTP